MREKGMKKRILGIFVCMLLITGLRYWSDVLGELAKDVALDIRNDNHGRNYIIKY